MTRRLTQLHDDAVIDSRLSRPRWMPWTPSAATSIAAKASSPVVLQSCQNRVQWYRRSTTAKEKHFAGQPLPPCRRCWTYPRQGSPVSVQRQTLSVVRQGARSWEAARQPEAVLLRWSPKCVLDRSAALGDARGRDGLAPTRGPEGLSAKRARFSRCGCDRWGN